VLGVDGAISGVDAVVPRASVDLREAVRAGDHELAGRLHEATLPLARAAVWDYPVNFSGGVRAAIDLLGRDPGLPRTPMRCPTRPVSRGSRTPSSTCGPAASRSRRDTEACPETRRRRYDRNDAGGPAAAARPPDRNALVAGPRGGGMHFDRRTQDAREVGLPATEDEERVELTLPERWLGWFAATPESR
jgi:hypothetical protein